MSTIATQTCSTETLFDVQHSEASSQADVSFGYQQLKAQRAMEGQLQHPVQMSFIQQACLQIQIQPPQFSAKLSKSHVTPSKVSHLTFIEYQQMTHLSHR